MPRTTTAPPAPKDKLKGTLSFEAKGESGAGLRLCEAGPRLRAEPDDGTATASGEVSAQGKLDLDGRVFEASGKGGLEVNLDKDSNIESIAVSMEGTVAQGASAGPDLQGAKLESTVTVGTQGSVKINVEYSPENSARDRQLHAQCGDG